MEEAFPLRVNVRLFSRPASALPPEDGDWTLAAEAHNLVVTTGKALVANMLAEQSGYDTGLTYCEVGTDNTTPTLADVALGTVTKRNAITRYIVGGNVAQYRTFYAAADVTAYIKEVGLFGHSTATSTAGTGEMFNRAIIDFDNSTGTKDLTAVVQVTFG